MTDVFVSVDSAVNFPELLLGLNEASGGWFVGILMIFIWIILVSSSLVLNIPFANANTFASLIIAILGVLFWSVGSLSAVFMVLPIVMLLVSLGVFLFSKKG